MDKHNLRRTMKECLSLIDEDSIAAMSSLLSKNLTRLFSDLNVIQKKIYIGAFAPIAKEPVVDLLHLDEIERLTSYPAYDQSSGEMTFKMARMRDLIVRKDFGPPILGPAPESREVVPGLVLVPGLVFSESGDRLGRGKGFYDKYLANYRGIKVGLCFSVQLVSAVAIEEHDVPLDYIVTEKEIIKCTRA